MIIFFTLRPVLHLVGQNRKINLSCACTLRLLILFHFFKSVLFPFLISLIYVSQLQCFQKLLPRQAKASPSIWQSSRKGKLNRACAVLAAPITPLPSEHTGVLRNNQPRCTTSHTSPTKDAPLLVKHLLMSALCTHYSHATVASAPSQHLDKGTWAGLCTSSACSQPAFKHSQKHHLLSCVRGFFFVGNSCLLFPISPEFVLLSIIRIKATSAQLGASEITNPYFFLLILYSFLLGPWKATLQWKSILHSLPSSQVTTILRSIDKDFSILAPLCPKTRVCICGIFLCFSRAFNRLHLPSNFYLMAAKYSGTQEQSLLSWLRSAWHFLRQCGKIIISTNSPPPVWTAVRCGPISRSPSLSRG